MFIYSFEKLEVWNDAKEFAKSIYTITSSFPESEKFILTSQLRRAAISIASNIAEGSARKSRKDQAHFTVMAFSSGIEALNQIIISFELGYISKLEYEKIRSQIEAITNKLNALRNYQTNTSTNKPLNE
ncbi:MAG: four helix bundle protein [Flavobacteriaceae bacterium]